MHLWRCLEVNLNFLWLLTVPIVLWGVRIAIKFARQCKMLHLEYKRYNTLAFEWNSWAKRYLHNQFWKQVAGKIPFQHDNVGQFAADLKTALPLIFKEIKPVANPSSSWLKCLSEELTAALFKISYSRHYQDGRYLSNWANCRELCLYNLNCRVYYPYASHYDEGEYRVYKEGCCISGNWLKKHLPEFTNYYNHITIKRLTDEFCAIVCRFGFGGLDAVLEEMPAQPTVAIADIPEAYIINSGYLLEARKFLTSPIDTSIADAETAVDALRKYAGDPAVAKLIAKMEEGLAIARARGRDITEKADAHAIQIEADEIRQKIAKSEAIQLASDKVCALIDDVNSYADALESIKPIDPELNQSLNQLANS